MLLLVQTYKRVYVFICVRADMFICTHTPRYLSVCLCVHTPAPAPACPGESVTKAATVAQHFEAPAALVALESVR